MYYLGNLSQKKIKIKKKDPGNSRGPHATSYFKIMILFNNLPESLIKN